MPTKTKSKGQAIMAMKIEKPRCYFNALTAQLECITVVAGEGGDMNDFVLVRVRVGCWRTSAAPP